MRRWRIVALVLCSYGSLSCGADTSELDRAIETELEAGHLPSIAAALIVDGELVWEGYYGWADEEAGRRPNAHTLYPVASVSKMFTSVPLMRLVEMGMVDLDAPVEESFGFSLVHPEHTDAPITLRQLLTHTSGVVDNWPALGQGTYTGSDPEMTLAQFVEAYAWPTGDLYSAESNFGEAERRTSTPTRASPSRDISPRSRGATTFET